MDRNTHRISMTFPLELERVPPSDRTTIVPAWQVVVHIDGEIARVPLHTNDHGLLQAILEVQGPIQTPDGAPDAPMVPLAKYRARRIARHQKGTPDAQ